MPMQPYIQWVVAVLMSATALSAVNRLWRHSYQSSVHFAILVGGTLSVFFFPLYTAYQLDSGRLVVGCLLVSGLGATMLRPKQPAGPLHWLTQRLREWRTTNQQFSDLVPLTSGPAETTAPPSVQAGTLRILEGAISNLPEGLVPEEARLELSWLYFEQGDLTSSLKQVRLALAHGVLLSAAKTDALRSWLRYLHCYQAILTEGAHHIDHERTCAQLKQMAWQRYQKREDVLEEVNMRKSKDIIGLRVVSIEEGEDVGTIGHIIPNVINGSVAGIALKRTAWYQPPLVIPFSFVVGISGDALTIENMSSIYPLSQLPDLEDLLKGGTDIIGLQVISKSGTVLGFVDEYLFDHAGVIGQYQLLEEASTIEAEQVITIGKSMLIVNDGVSLNPANAPTHEPPLTRDKHKKVEQVVAAQKQATRPQASATTEADRLRQLVAEQQEDSILGKQSGRTLLADSGAPIIREGEAVTTEVIAKAKKANRFRELVESARIART